MATAAADSPLSIGSIQFDDFSPEFLLQKHELQLATRLLRRIRNLQALWVAAGYKDTPETASRGKYSEELENLALQVLKRRCGIDRYMVVHVTREGGYEQKFQVLQVDLMDDFAGYRLGWSLHGHALRKDDMVGSRSAGMGFRRANISRRRLDGSWQHIRLAA